MKLRATLPKRIVHVVLNLPRGDCVLVTVLLPDLVLFVMPVPRFPWRMVMLIIIYCGRRIFNALINCIYGALRRENQVGR